MSKSARRPQQLFQIIMWILSIIFAGFLIGFGSLVIRDLPKVDKALSVEQYVDQSARTVLESQKQTLHRLRDQLNDSHEDAQADFRSAQADYISAEESFNNWVKTRSSTESVAQNPEVLSRTREVERLKTRERATWAKVEALEVRLVQADRDLNELQKESSALYSSAQPEYRRARRAQELRVFAYRLALTLPLLVIAGLLLARQRDSSYWPLYRGFVIFALFAFFVELVPYLPSYGGYVRFAVGIIGVLIAGHFLIRGMRQYLARKSLEEARSESERRQSITYETALKKIAAKTCPGCDRTIITRDGVDTDFCVHCGIRLQTDCQSCGARNISFHKFCLSCGVPSATATDDATA